jgi:DNA invertase Pin-like site-specific DNA recombinase
MSFAAPCPAGAGEDLGGYASCSRTDLIGIGAFPDIAYTIRAYAEKHGYTIEKIFREEGVSGTLDETDRPAFQSIISEIL